MKLIENTNLTYAASVGTSGIGAGTLFLNIIPDILSIAALSIGIFVTLSLYGLQKRRYKLDIEIKEDQLENNSEDT